MIIWYSLHQKDRRLSESPSLHWRVPAAYALYCMSLVASSSAIYGSISTYSTRSFKATISWLDRKMGEVSHNSFRRCLVISDTSIISIQRRTSESNDRIAHQKEHFSGPLIEEANRKCLAALLCVKTVRSEKFVVYTLHLLINP